MSNPRGEHNTVRWAVQQVRLIPERARGLLFSGLMSPAASSPGAYSAAEPSTAVSVPGFRNLKT